MAVLLGTGNVTFAFIHSFWLLRSPTLTPLNTAWYGYGSNAMVTKVYTHFPGNTPITFGGANSQMELLTTKHDALPLSFGESNSALTGKWYVTVLPGSQELKDLNAADAAKADGLTISFGALANFNTGDAAQSGEAMKIVSASFGAQAAVVAGGFIMPQLADFEYRTVNVGSAASLKSRFNIASDVTGPINGQVTLLGFDRKARSIFNREVGEKREMPDLQPQPPAQRVHAQNSLSSAWEQTLDVHIKSSTNAFRSVETVWVYKLDDGRMVASLVELDVNTLDKDTSIDAFAESMNQRLLLTATKRSNGLDVVVDRTFDKPDLTGLSESAKTNYTKWLEEWTEMADRVDAMPLGTNTSYNALKAQLASRLGRQPTTEEIDSALATQLPKRSTNNWSSVWESLKQGGLNLLDVVKEWGPLQIAGGYAGIKATNALSASGSIVPWLLAGAAAIVILK